jgi:hypothetical protein
MPVAGVVAFLRQERQHLHQARVAAHTGDPDQRVHHLEQLVLHERVLDLRPGRADAEARRPVWHVAALPAGQQVLRGTVGDGPVGHSGAHRERPQDVQCPERATRLFLVPLAGQVWPVRVPAPVGPLPGHRLRKGAFQPQVTQVAEARECIRHHVGQADVWPLVVGARVVKAAMQERAARGLGDEHALGNGGDALVVAAQAEIRQRGQLPEVAVRIVAARHGPRRPGPERRAQCGHPWMTL